jgi:hypothetical protein
MGLPFTIAASGIGVSVGGMGVGVALATGAIVGVDRQPVAMPSVRYKIGRSRVDDFIL